MNYTKEEKQILFKFLQLADNLYYGYKRKEFSVMPSFTDDVDDPIKEPVTDYKKNDKSLYSTNNTNYNSSVLTPPTTTATDQALIDEKGLSSNQLSADTIIARLNIKPIEGIEVEKAHHKGSYTSNPSINDNKTINETSYVNNDSNTVNNNLLSKKEDENNINNFSLGNVNTTSIKNNNITEDKPKPHLHDRTVHSIEELNVKIRRCTRCGLSRTRHHVVAGEGVLNPDVLVIGEGPKENEDMEGRPFIGEEGALLDRMLNSIYLDRRENCYISNIVKCRPPRDRDPFPDEKDACFSFLEQQIKFLKPKMILCFSKIAVEKLLNKKVSINECHGQFFNYKNIPLMLTYHPDTLLKDKSLKKLAWEDLKGFSRKLDSIKVSMGEQINHVLKCLQK